MESGIRVRGRSEVSHRRRLRAGGGSELLKPSKTPSPDQNTPPLCPEAAGPETCGLPGSADLHPRAKQHQLPTLNRTNLLNSLHRSRRFVTVPFLALGLQGLGLLGLWGQESKRLGRLGLRDDRVAAVGHVLKALGLKRKYQSPETRKDRMV